MLRGLSFKELARYSMRVAVVPGHRLAKAKSLSLAQVAAEPLLAYDRKEYPEFHEMLAKVFQSIRVKPKIVEEHDGVNGLIAAVESGRGVALLPNLLSCMVGARLKLIPLTEPTPEIILGAAWKGDTAPPMVEQFIAAAAAVPPIDLSN
jgi:DNA-binding transcriptional LysR family regulator